RLEARALFDELRGIEAGAGRDRAREQPQGPRVLDLDLLLYGDAVLRDPDLVGPPPPPAQRALPPAPLQELVGPEHVIPGAGRVGPLLARARETQPIAKIV